MDVDRARQPDDPVDDRTTDEFGPSAPAACAENDLSCVLRPGRRDERRSDVAPGDLDEPSTDLLDEVAMVVHAPVVDGEAVVAADMDGQEVAVGPLGDAGGAADQVIGAGRTGQGEHDSLTRLPAVGDVVALAVRLQPGVDLIGHPQQGELAQRCQVPRAEVVSEGGVDLLRRVNVAVGHAP